MQERFFRAAHRPGDFSAFNPRCSKEKKKFRYLKTLLLTADLLKTKSVDSFHLLKFQQLLIIYEESGQ